MKYIADAAFALACMVLVAVVVRNQYVRADNVPKAREGAIAVGTPFPDVPADDGQMTLVIYLSPTCPFCQESMPFYRKLSARVRQSRNTRLAYPMSAEATMFKTYLSTNGLDPTGAAPLPVVAGVRGTPTIVAVSAGVVSGSWAGRLNPEQEGQLLALVR